MRTWFPSLRRRPRFRPYVARPASISLEGMIARCNRALYDAFSADCTAGLGLDKLVFNPLFDYQKLLQLLEAIPRVRFLTMEELMGSVPDGSVRITIRHDVDADIVAARSMAALEHERGIRTTYYLLHTSWYYGRFARGIFERNECMGPYYREIQDLGHEIGLHTDGLHVYQEFRLDGASAVEQELAWLRSQGLRVVGSAAHNLHTVYGAQNYEIFRGRVRHFTTPDHSGEPTVDEDEVFFEAKWAPLHTLDERALGLVYEGHDAYNVPGYLGIMAETGYSTIHQTWNRGSDYAKRGLSRGPGDFAQLVDAMSRLRPGDAVVFTTHPCYYGGRHSPLERPALLLDRATRLRSERFGLTTYAPGSLVAVSSASGAGQTGQAIGFANDEGFLAKPVRTLPEGALNVVIFGGRQLEAAHLGIPDQVQARLEALLGRALDRPVQVRSFASSDLEPRQHVTIYRAMDPRLRPATVLAAAVSQALVDAVAADGGRVCHLLETPGAGCGIQGVTVIDPHAAFAAHAGPGKPIDAEGRWTATGHRLAAKACCAAIAPVTVVNLRSLSYTGTTWINIVLGSHAEAFAMGPPDRFAALWSTRPEELCLVHGAACPFWPAFCRRYDPAQNFFVQLALASGRRVIVINNPVPTGLGRELDHPGVRVRTIHVVRDGRAVAASYARRFGKPFADVVRDWYAPAAPAIPFAEPGARYHSLRYEDFVQRPAETLSALGRFVGLDYTIDSLRYWDHEHHPVGGNQGLFALIRLHQGRPAGEIEGAEFYQRLHEAETADPLRPRLDDRWRSQLTAEDRRVFDALCGAHNARLGYPRDTRARLPALRAHA